MCTYVLDQFVDMNQLLIAGLLRPREVLLVGVVFIFLFCIDSHLLFIDFDFANLHNTVRRAVLDDQALPACLRARRGDLMV